MPSKVILKIRMASNRQKTRTRNKALRKTPMPSKALRKIRMASNHLNKTRTLNKALRKIPTHKQGILVKEEQLELR